MAGTELLAKIAMQQPSRETGVTMRLCRADGSIDIVPLNDSLAPAHADAFLWVHVEHPVEGVLGPVAARFDVHPLVVEDMLNARQRTKIESYGEAQFVVVRALRLDGEEVANAEAQLLLARSYIVTVCHGRAVTSEDVMERARAVPGPLAAWKILYAVMDLIVDHFQPVAVMIERRFESLEDELFEQSFRSERIEQLYHIKRLVLRLLSTAAPVDDLVAQLTSGSSSLVPAGASAHFRDIADHSQRLTEEATHLKEMVDAALNVNMALVTLGQNEIVKRLAGWGAVLAVPTMVFSLYGMNFVDMPELKWHYGYPAALIGVVVISWVLYARLKKVGWL